MVEKASKREIMRSVRDSNINYAAETLKIKPDEKRKREITAARRSVLVRGAG